jgi:hypothetical protein
VTAALFVTDRVLCGRLAASDSGYDNHKAVKIFMPAGANAPIHAPFVQHDPLMLILVRRAWICAT